MTQKYSDEKIKELESKIRSLPRRIIEVQESERHRISKEIHDDLGQSLAALKMLIQSSVDPEYLNTKTNHRAYESVINYIDEIIDKTREIATALRPKVIETQGLTRAVKKLLAAFRKSKGIHIKARIGNLNPIQFQGARIHLYRILQEALANLYHHAEATHVEVLFRRGKQSLTMVIKDNGKGFLPDKAKKDIGQTGKHGLSTMHERARMLGGELKIESEPGKGTLIHLNVPVKLNDTQQES